ncbi:hypothetical protein LINPERPRIM_LOCUS14530 [Linum perenne]
MSPSLASYSRLGRYYFDICQRQWSGGQCDNH